MIQIRFLIQTSIAIAPCGLIQVDSAQQSPQFLCRDLSLALLALSPNGTAYVPSSNRLLHTANPSRSQYRIFTRSLRRLANTNRCPAKAIQTPGCSRTKECSPSKLLRIIACCQAKIHPHAGRKMDHIRRASSTVRNVVASTPAPMRNRSPVRQHQLQRSLRRRLLPCRSSIHQSETYRLFVLEAFAPGVEGIFCQPLFFAELLYGDSLRCAPRFVRPTRRLWGWVPSPRG